MKKNKINKDLMISIIIIVSSLIVILIAVLYVQEYLFFPIKYDEECYNALLNDVKANVDTEFKEIKIVSNGKKLNGWVKFNVTDKKAPLLIFFVGNYQDSSSTFVSFYQNDLYKYFENYNIMIVDYPGYGLSDGKPSDKTMFDAALKVYDYAQKQEYVDTNNIVLLGYSIGTGVVTYLASERDVNGLILISPYDQALSLYNHAANIFYGPLKLLTRYKFNSIEYAQNINVAPLIITSKDDAVIDYTFSLNLAKYFKNVYKTVVLEGISHIEYFDEESVLNDIHEYLQSVLK